MKFPLAISWKPITLSSNDLYNSQLWLTTIQKSYTSHNHSLINLIDGETDEIQKWTSDIYDILNLKCIIVYKMKNYSLRWTDQNPNDRIYSRKIH